MENFLLAIYRTWPKTVHLVLNLMPMKKFIKNLILLRINSNYIFIDRLYNIRTCMCIRKNIKVDDFHLAIFDKI